MIRMLSSFLTEDLFKKGLAVSALGQPWVRGAGRAGASLQPCPGPQAQPATRAEWWSLGHQLSPHRGLFPQSYLQTFSYKSTTYLDLWEHLQKVGNNLPPSPPPPPEPFCWGPEMLDVPEGGGGGEHPCKGMCPVHCPPARAGHLEPWLVIGRMGAMIAP